jgi:hypothetical protein
MGQRPVAIFANSVDNPFHPLPQGFDISFQDRFGFF